MSWQATAWAQLQKTGKPARKALLLVLANYADEHGRCWPSQKTLADACEMSHDTVQRHIHALRSRGLLTMEKREVRRGRWPVWHYTLNMKFVAPTDTQIAARSKVPDKVPNSGTTDTQPGRRPTRNQDADRHAQLCVSNSKINHQENLHLKQQPLRQAEAPQTSNKRNRRDIQALQLAVCTKLGEGNVAEGWLIFGELEAWQRKQLETLEANGELDRARVADVHAIRSGAAR